MIEEIRGPSPKEKAYQRYVIDWVFYSEDDGKDHTA